LSIVNLKPFTVIYIATIASELKIMPTKAWAPSFFRSASKKISRFLKTISQSGSKKIAGYQLLAVMLRGRDLAKSFVHFPYKFYKTFLCDCV
jgi:hypothetical protein